MAFINVFIKIVIVLFDETCYTLLWDSNVIIVSMQLDVKIWWSLFKIISCAPGIMRLNNRVNKDIYK